VGRSHTELDLTNQREVKSFFDQECPEVVVLAAAHVGGIRANSLYRADFIMKNMQMECNVIEESFRHNVKKLLFLGSSCIYPRNAPQPIKEEYLLTSPLEYTNEEYAIAKIAGLKMCESYNLQYGTNYIAVMPTNLYGPQDNFHLENAHVMPSIMRKIYLSKLLSEENWEEIKRDLTKYPIEGIYELQDTENVQKVLGGYGIYPNEVSLWGTGKPLREFLWSEDMADACVYILLNIDFSQIINQNIYSTAQQEGSSIEKGETNRNKTIGRGGAIPSLGEIRNCHINIGSGEEITIENLANKVAETIGFKGNISFDDSKPDGTYRKLLDSSKLHSLGWRHKIGIDEGIKKLFEEYKKSIAFLKV